MSLYYMVVLITLLSGLSLLRFFIKCFPRKAVEDSLGFFSLLHFRKYNHLFQECTLKIFVIFWPLHTAHHVGSQFPKQGSNLLPLHWKCEVLTTGPPGKAPRNAFDLAKFRNQLQLHLWGKLTFDPIFYEQILTKTKQKNFYRILLRPFLFFRLVPNYLKNLSFVLNLLMCLKTMKFWSDI